MLIPAALQKMKRMNNKREEERRRGKIIRRSRHNRFRNTTLNLRWSRRQLNILYYNYMYTTSPRSAACIMSSSTQREQLTSSSLSYTYRLSASTLARWEQQRGAAASHHCPWSSPWREGSTCRRRSKVKSQGLQGGVGHWCLSRVLR